MRSGRWQARFTVPLGHPSGRGSQIITAPHTFEPTTYGKEAAGDWLRDEERRLNAEGAAWATVAEHAEAERARAERKAVVTFGEFSATWLRTRRTKNGPLQESTRRGYQLWLDKYLFPTLGDLPLDQITPSVVLRWYEEDLPHDKPKTTRECYALGSAIMRTATAADGILAGAVNPFKIDGAGSFGARSRARTEVIDDHDLQVIMSTIRPEWRAMVALALGCGFVPVRKAGKLPRETYAVAYALEYGEATLELHQDSVAPGERVLMVDDVLATGGTVAATTELIRRCGGEAHAVSVLLELGFLDGRSKTGALPVASVVTL